MIPRSAWRQSIFSTLADVNKALFSLPQDDGAAHPMAQGLSAMYNCRTLG